MIHSSPFPGDWEKEELENPLGNTERALNVLTKELTVRSTVENEEGDDIWDDLRCYVRKATLLEGLTSIRNRTFKEHWMLDSVQIPMSVVSVGDEAFYACYCLKSVTLPRSIVSIGDKAFAFLQRIGVNRIP